MRGPKLVIVGAGSHFFARPVVWNAIHSPVLREGTLALVDTDAERAGTMGELARRAREHLGAPIAIEAGTDRRALLRGADFVITTFADRNAHFRGVDCRLAEKHGISMCSGDTIGPGGIFRALREVPTLLAVARDVEELAPDAWLINFVNPSTVLGIALERYSSLRSFAICDGPHEPHHGLRLLREVGVLGDDDREVPPELAARLDLRIAGINHFSWVTRFRLGGRDLMPELRRSVAEWARREREETERQDSGLDAHHHNARAKAAYNATYRLELFDVFGAMPDCIAHTKEYVPFYQGWGVAPIEPEPLRVFDAEDRQEAMDRRWAGTAAFARGDEPIERFIAEGGPDHATDIVESMWGGLGKVFRVNTPNRGAVPNLPDDAFLELACHLDMNTLSTLPAGELPLGLRGRVAQVHDTHALTAMAAAECDCDLLLRAFATDPLTVNLADARALIDELLDAERDALPAEWFAS